MADTIQPSPVAPEAGTTPNHPAPDRADLRPENIQDAVIRLAGNSQDGIQTAGAYNSNKNFKYLEKKKIRPCIKVRKSSIIAHKNNMIKNIEVNF